jgi:FlaA1/EpsC-like NDP-sugar epimerase
LSRDEVQKYFEVRFFSLALMAIAVVAVCVFLFVFFASRGQYVYAVAVIALAVAVFLAALELLGYVKSLKKGEKAAAQKTKTIVFIQRKGSSFAFLEKANNFPV